MYFANCMERSELAGLKQAAGKKFQRELSTPQILTKIILLIMEVTK